jgi:hypothetical protein
MKNIHVLPTSQPSNLLLCIKSYIEHKDTPAENSDNKGNFRLGFGIYANKVFYQHQNIYITNSEEIKEGDWFLEKAGRQYPIQWNGEEKLNFHCKKIILTTDQDLIKDGVQAIDDEFLEFIVKNPSCKRVEVVEDTFTVKEMSKLPLGTRNHKYKIIIPKEEPKQECECTDECLGYLTKECKRIEEPKQELYKTEIDWSGFPKSTQEQVGFTEPNIINDWLDKNGNPEIAKQVEEEAKELCKEQMIEELFKKFAKEKYPEFETNLIDSDIQFFSIKFAQFIDK